ncbi:MAG: 5-formyltetrahydrofolate cyclo-ligase [Clostridiales Family XIII bacterium]|nr:5-formyltetrahydrofolate cyclo-ligase [Clostridiales Family XIII bacterium]
MQEKAELRKILNARLLELDDAYLNTSDAAINAHLIASDAYAAAHTIFSYVGLKKEIRTMPFIIQALADGKRVCAPSIVGAGLMDARLITKPEDLAAGYQDLTEPTKDCPVADPKEIDLIIVPCLSCDTLGGRIGYGGGYYDRYLKQTRPDACKIIVCRKQMMCPPLPFGHYDVRADRYVTEEGLFRVTQPLRL